MTWLAGLLTSGWARLIPWIAGIACFLCAGLFIHHQTAQIANLRASLAQASTNTATAESAAHANAAALDEATRQHAVDLAALDVHYRNLASINALQLIAIERINDEPPANDGPVAPVLLRALGCLRGTSGDAAGAVDPDCPHNTAPGAAVMPAKP